MLAHVRSCLQVFVLLVFALVAGSPASAQINGVPASVTSFGFGGKANPTPGVRASVTSLGPNGYGNQAFWGNCCANFFMPANPNLSLFPNGSSPNHLSTGHRRRHKTDRNTSVIGVYEPVYVPYAVPNDAAYADDSDDSDDDDGTPDPSAEYVQGNGPRRPNAAARRGPGRDGASSVNSDPADGNPADGDQQAAYTPPDPVVAQPTTTLVFNDGHKSDIENYAIVGDTLFDFTGGRTRKILLADLNLPATHKVNDDRGVDFQVPARQTALSNTAPNEPSIAHGQTQLRVRLRLDRRLILRRFPS